MMSLRSLSRRLVLACACASFLVVGLGCWPWCGGRADEPAAKDNPGEEAEVAGKAKEAEWVSLFDGKSLGDWEVVAKEDFEMHGPVEVKDGMLVLKTGMPFTGIVRKGDFPTENYEIELEAMRVRGIDIFCGLTFPVGGEHVTLVLGGWGDSVVGLSSVDGMNASENQYVIIRGFENKKWYPLRVRVTGEKILAWLEGKQILDVPWAKHKFTVYPQLEIIRPLGFFSWDTEAALRNIRYRKLQGGD